jgi:hypothetical protein
VAGWGIVGSLCHRPTFFAHKPSYLPEPSAVQPQCPSVLCDAHPNPVFPAGSQAVHQRTFYHPISIPVCGSVTSVRCSTRLRFFLKSLLSTKEKVLEIRGLILALWQEVPSKTENRYPSGRLQGHDKRLRPIWDGFSVLSLCRPPAGLKRACARLAFGPTALNLEKSSKLPNSSSNYEYNGLLM